MPGQILPGFGFWPIGSAEYSFFSKVEIRPGSTCWWWTGAVHKGYGRFIPLYGERGGGSGRQKRVDAHRWAYERWFGPIANGLHLDHQCDNTLCVNLDHLAQVTPADNILRGKGLPAQNARKTHCIRGHSFDRENTYRPPSGGRYCKTCRRLRRRAN